MLKYNIRNGKFFAECLVAGGRAMIKSIKRLVVSFLIVTMICVLVPGMGSIKAYADSREKVTEVEVVSNFNSIPLIGSLIEDYHPTFGYPGKTPYSFTNSSSNGWWLRKQEDGTFAKVTFGSFIEGKWKYRTQLRIEEGDKYAFEKGNLTVKVDNVNWDVDWSTFQEGNGFSWVYVTSPEMDAKVDFPNRVTVENLQDAVYTGSEIIQDPVVKYGDKVLVEGKDYKVSYSDNINSGLGHVNLEGLGLYVGTLTRAFNIAPKEIREDDIKSSAIFHTDGAMLVEDYFEVTDGDKILTENDYDFEWPDDPFSVGIHSASIRLKGNYIGLWPAEYEVFEEEPKIKLNKESFVYDGNIHKPTVTVTLNGKTLKLNTDYRIEFKDNCKAVGRYSFKLVWIGYYRDANDRKIYFNIIPKATSIKSLTPGRKQMKVTWIKKTSQVTGYEVQLSLKKSFASPIKKTITKNRTVTCTLKKLKPGKKYFVRVRTYKKVGGLKIYSKWSKVVSKKIKK